VADNSWDEGSLNFQNAPALGEVIAVHSAASNRGNCSTVDVSSYINGEGVFTLGLTSDSSNRLRWQSRENENGPELLIILGPNSTPQATNTPTPLPTLTATAVATNTPLPTTQPTAVPTNTPPATAVPTQTPVPPATTVPPSSGTIVVDHTSIALFHQIPEAYLQAAADMSMLFIGRSVSANINDGLTCLSYATDEAAPNHCSRTTHPNVAYSVSPDLVNWERTGGYNRSNWTFQPWQGDCSYWYDKIDCFINMTNATLDQYDVVSLQYSYLAVDHNSSIADQPGGYFWDNADRLDVYDQASYEAAHPNTVFIYSTTSLSRGLGSASSDTFNAQMRAYAIENNKPLFDVADILSHDPNGNPCFDNRDGVYYDNGNRSENHADDGRQNLAICPHYTTETDGGHLGSVSAGKIRVAQAYWVLMAQIAGWDGNTN
jgi:hypothetical protein